MGDLIKMSEFNTNNNNNNKRYNQDYNGENNNNSSISDRFKQAFQKIPVYYNQKSVKSVKIQFITNSIHNFELPKDVGTAKLPDFRTFYITDPEVDNEVEKLNVGRIDIKEAEDKLGHIEAIQIMFATEALFIEDMEISREFRIPYHAVANIDIEHITRYDSNIDNSGSHLRETL
jgi:hypothetical protein